MTRLREARPLPKGADPSDGRTDGDPFAPIDLHFARLIERLHGEPCPPLFQAALLLSRSARDGDICLDLAAVAGGGRADAPPPPDLDRWRRTLLGSAAVGTPGDEKPLILDGASRLYLFRYWQYEEELARFLIERGRPTDDRPAAGREPEIDLGRVREGLDRLFPAPPFAGSGPAPADWQRVAAVATLLSDLVVISGGPGTGKTHTVARAILLLLAQPPGRGLRVALAAPTGKAAARLEEAFLRAVDRREDDREIRAALPGRATTLHRLLGARPDGSGFRHDRANPLPFDVVVVDEASMVDLPLMARLIRALPQRAKLILLGDRNQLASVEAGAVLSDICGSGAMNRFSAGFRRRTAGIARLPEGAPEEAAGGAPESRIADCLIELRTSHRFPEAGAIHRLSQAIVRGDGDGAFAILAGEGSEACRWQPLPSASGLERLLEAAVSEHFKGFIDQLEIVDEYASLLDCFDRFRIFCPLRGGPFGVTWVNRLCERILRRQGLIRTDAAWYPGRPLLITRNDPSTGLYNGDVGLILPDRERPGQVAAYFRNPSGGVRRVATSRLPEHETVHAMTIHKGQGSEFDRVLLILPDIDTPLLTRELLYTAVTRARKAVGLWGVRELFVRAVGRRLRRASGLPDALRLPPAAPESP